MKARIAALIALMVVVVLLLGGGAWWYVKDHQRIGQTELVSTVVKQTGANRAVCQKMDGNGAHWLCVVSGAPSTGPCVRAHVKPWGSVKVVKAYQRCSEVPALKPLVKTPKPASTGSSS